MTIDSGRPPSGRAGGPSDPSPQAVSTVPALIADAVERYWMKEPCGPCPYSRSKTLPLHPERAADFAYSASNPYNDFVCHKTAEIYEDEESSEFVRGKRSFTCNGFLSLQCRENDIEIEDFMPHDDAFFDCEEMIERHEALWEDRQRPHAQGMSAREGENSRSEVEGDSPPARSSEGGCAQPPSSGDQP